MEPDFWQERWREGQIGFHLGHENPALVRHHAVLGPVTSPASRVLVPLCGKSLDLVWLAQQGHSVVGVELSALAVEAFFAEQKLQPVIDQHGPFTRYRVSSTRDRVGAIEILCGDLFELDRQLLGPVSACFDRAALVAFPPSMRERYAEQIAALLPADARVLLITFEYEPASVAGPPFSVDEANVRALYGSSFSVAQLERRDILDAEPRFKQRGMQMLHEAVYALQRSSGPR